MPRKQIDFGKCKTEKRIKVSHIDIAYFSLGFQPKEQKESFISYAKKLKYMALTKAMRDKILEIKRQEKLLKENTFNFENVKKYR